MRTGRPKKALEMCDDDREKLTTIARRPKSSQALAMRARIVLDCARGLSNSEVAQKLRIAGATDDGDDVTGRSHGQSSGPARQTTTLCPGLCSRGYGARSGRAAAGM